MEKKYEDYYVAFIDVLGFKELLEKYMTYKDGKEQVSKKWRAIYQNSPSPTVPLSVMLQDENVKREAFESMEFLINYLIHLLRLIYPF